jgi:hypothetical protein
VSEELDDWAASAVAAESKAEQIAVVRRFMVLKILRKI